MINATFKTLGLAAMLSVGATTYAAAFFEPWDLPSCYLSIHDTCYGNGEENCTEEDYNMGLDWCHEVKWEAAPQKGGKSLKLGSRTIKQRAGNPSAVVGKQ